MVYAEQWSESGSIMLSEEDSLTGLHIAGLHLCDILENYGDGEETSGCQGLGMRGGGR